MPVERRAIWSSPAAGWSIVLRSYMAVEVVVSNFQEAFLLHYLSVIFDQTRGPEILCVILNFYTVLLFTGNSR